MSIGITRVRTTLVVNTLWRREKDRETVAGIPGRLIEEMNLSEHAVNIAPRENLKSLRDAAAATAAAGRP